MSELKGFPLISTFNAKRTELNNLAYEWCEPDSKHSDAQQLAAFWGHKIISIPSFLLNGGAVAVGLTGMAATFAVVGTIKQLGWTIFKKEWPAQTGFRWCTERTAHSAHQLDANVGEILMTPLFIARRLWQGFKKASTAEKLEWKWTTPSIIKPIHDLTEQCRVDLAKGDRSVKEIFKHYGYSLVDIPLNLGAAVVSAAATTALFSIYCGKAALYAGVNINIPLPTYFPQAFNTTAVTASNVAKDIKDCVIDSNILAYKTAKALKLTNVFHKIIDIVGYLKTAYLEVPQKT